MHSKYWTRLGLLGLSLALIVSLVPSTAGARTIAVPDEVASIAGAMDRAVAGDIILVGCGTYNEHDIRFKSGVSLWSGTLQPDCTIIDAGGRGRVFQFTACDSTTAIVGITMRGGVTAGDGGAILCIDAAPRFSRCVIQDNRGRRGGALACEGNSSPRLEDCVIRGNEALLQGGGVFWNSDAGGRLSRCTITDNHALAGGGLACLRAARLRLSEVDIIANVGAPPGGGVWIGGGAPQFNRSIIGGNLVGLDGGAVDCPGGRPGLVSCTLVDNGGETGGVLVRTAGDVRLERTIVAFNRGFAASIVTGGQLSLATSNIYGNSNGDWAGALAAQASLRGNFSLDPRFCGRQTGDFTLSGRSPCLPDNRGGDALVGARGRGCP